MMKPFCIIAVLFLLSCKTTTFFVVRHAEKETATALSTDVPLSDIGKERAMALRDELKSAHIKHIYSTNFIRTRSTAQPLSDATGIVTEIYDARDSGFVAKIKTGNRNVLIVGHSNTVDDIVNGFMDKKELSDLPDSAYGDLFVVKKKSNKYRFEKKHFGK